MRGRRCVLSLGLAVAIGVACAPRWWQARFFQPGVVEPPGPAPFLKCHGTAGELWVLDGWTVDGDHRLVSGTGRLYDADRNLVERGAFQVPFDRVAIAETNQPEAVTRGGLIALGIVTGASLVGTAACAANPKACFGSCPTFYVRDDRGDVLVAEGFSSSVTRALEATDVDALDVRVPHGPTLDLEMRNEALETHFVRSVSLLAAARPPGGRVLREGERFLAARRLAPVQRCEARGADCTALVSAADGQAWRSYTDGRDLAARERIDLTFPAPAGRAALVIRARNTLLDTFVFYQALAWMGSRTGEWLARHDQPGAPAQPIPSVGDVFAAIRVEVRTEAGWVPAGEFREVGPLAWETQAISIPETRSPGPLQVRLEATRGNWWIDQASLADVAGEVEPIALLPTAVRRGSAADPDALRRLTSADEERLVTLPGDRYVIRFDIPSELREAEIFLVSRGYYYEWIREQWLREEDPVAVARFVSDPGATLRELAPAWARMERDADAVFWSSQVRGAP